MDNSGYTGITRTFRAVNDLDENYMPDYAAEGLSKAETLDRITFNFRNGALMPASILFDAFNALVLRVVQLGVPGFAPVSREGYDLLQYAYVARQRMEFVKRLFSPTHGIYSQSAIPLIDETVNVYALAPDGEFTVNPKIVQQAKRKSA
jgi:hypothetical protein